MTQSPTTTPERTFSPGLCVIVNHFDQPCGKLLAIVVDVDGQDVLCCYVNADPALDGYQTPPMRFPSEIVTHVCDFGVDVETDTEGHYWCEQRGESIATYTDGTTRPWQEHGQPIKYRGRPDLMKLIA